jgi:hypothetical protein
MPYIKGSSRVFATRTEPQFAADPAVSYRILAEPESHFNMLSFKFSRVQDTTTSSYFLQETYAMSRVPEKSKDQPVDCAGDDTHHPTRTRNLASN